MYKRHSYSLVIITILSGFASWTLNIPYVEFASDAITVVSTAIAVHLTAITLLIGTKIADFMRKQDKYIPSKTQLGVLLTYLNRAVIMDIISIITSCIAKSYCNVSFSVLHPNTYKLISAIGVALFIATIFFMWVIFQFIASALLRNE